MEKVRPVTVVLPCRPYDLPIVFLEYVRVVDSCKDIINTVNPGIVVLDSFLAAACDACLSLNKRYIVSCPVAPLDVARDSQPMWKLLFHYPV